MPKEEGYLNFRATAAFTVASALISCTAKPCAQGSGYLRS